MTIFDFFNNPAITLEKTKEGFDTHLGEATAAWVLRKISKLNIKNNIDIDSKVIKGLENFLSRQYKKNYYLPTIVLEKQCPLYKLYVPLHIIDSENNNEFKACRNFNSFLSENKKNTSSRYCRNGEINIIKIHNLKRI